MKVKPKVGFKPINNMSMTKEDYEYNRKLAELEEEERKKRESIKYCRNYTTKREAIALKILKELKYFSELIETGDMVILENDFNIVSKSIAHDIATMIDKGELE